MIKDKRELYNCLYEDSRNYQKQLGFFSRLKGKFWETPISDQRYIWKYIKTMRYIEYYMYKHTFLSMLCRLFYTYKIQKYARITGFQIHPGTLGEGVTIWHWGMIIIHQDVRIGKNCTLQPDVVIGKRQKKGNLPIIGNNVYICAGARILGNIKIGDNVIVAPNTVVFKNIPDNCVVAGNPACIIKQNGQKVHIPLL